MKKLPLLVSLLLGTLHLHAQDWRPLQPGYVYQYDDQERKYFNQNTGINHLRVVSKGVENGDSVYYLNPVVLRADMHAQININWAKVNHRGLINGIPIKNQPYFLGRKVRITADNDWILDEKFTLKPKAALGDKWIFFQSGDSILQAEVTGIQQETFLKVTDEVKTIALSNGDAIKLSKNHGIVWFPYFNAQHNGLRLKGVDGPNIGIVIPLARRIFDFQPGDIYQYYHADNNVNNVGQYVRQVIIQSRTESAAAISYKVREITQKNGKVSLATRNISFSLTDPELSLYPDEFSESNQLGLPYTTDGQKRHKYTSMSSYDYYKWEPASKGSDTLIPVGMYNSCPSESQEDYVMGLGMTYSSEDGMGGKWEMQLTAYRKADGRSGGTIMQIDTSTSIATSIYPPTSLSIYPNPAKGGSMTVIGHLSRPGALQLTLTDLQGRTIISAPSRELPAGDFSQTLNLGQVRPGVYLLRLNSESSHEVMRVTVVND